MNKKIDDSLLKIFSLNSDCIKQKCIIFAHEINKLKRILINKFGDQIFVNSTEFPFIDAICVEVCLNTIKYISEDVNVAYITSMPHVECLLNKAREILNINLLHEQNIAGENVTIAYIDTGIMPHLDFVMPENRILEFYDVINNKSKPYDDNGHGTFVAGVGSGNGLVSNKKYCGIAPNSKVVGIKALSENGQTGAIQILEGMQWVYNNAERLKIKVCCMSFGSEPLSINDPIVMGAEKLYKKGICVVSAAGNSGPEYETIKSPGVSTKIITVGGIDDGREDNAKPDIANFSSRGPAFSKIKPDLVAPAVDIVSCSAGSNFYTKLSGTSVATPMIAGICALLLQKYPNATPDYIKYKIIKSCVKITGNKYFEGYGLVNGSKIFK